MAEILASIDDINANLPSEEVAGGGAVTKADAINTALLQVSVARVVRGYLSRVIDSTILMGWDSPAETPEIVREAAAKMIAAHLYFNRNARTSLIIEDESFAQKRYNEAMEILKGIINGSIEVSNVIITSDELTLDDFHPIDDTDRAFSIGMEL